MFAWNRLLYSALAFGVISFATAVSSAEEPKTAPAEPASSAKDDAPPATDILDTLARTEKFKLFLKAVEAAGVEEELRKLGPFTVFAPNDEALSKLPVGTFEKLLADKARMTAILHGHIVPGKLSSAALAEAKMAKTLSQATLTITPATKELPLKVENASVVAADVATTNGVVHVIDVMLVPK
jgi:uncharacterized surface protein with fasciclin (FAS1) repeats